MRFVCVTIVFVTSVLAGIAQDNADQWLRVLTEEESILDIRRSSLVLEGEQVISAQFRTKFSKPTPVPGKSSIEYQTRLDSIQFSIKDKRYRVAESTLYDASGRVVSTSSLSSADGWRPLRGRTADRLLSAASQLQPFGVWRALSYRYAAGDPPSDQDPAELKALVGSEIVFNLDRLNVAGKDTCHEPKYSPRAITDEDFVKSVGSSIRSLGIGLDKVDAILLSCEPRHSSRVQTFIIRLPANKAIMLWEGVFLELERTRNLFLP